MVEHRGAIKPFGVESRARHYRVAFLVDLDACAPELLDSLFETNYGLWGGRFNPIVPVRNGEIDEAFLALLKYVDPDLIYTYTPLSQITIDRIEREIGPWRIEAHPPHLSGPDKPVHFSPSLSKELVQSRQVLPLLMAQNRSFVPATTTLLTYFTNWTTPVNRELVRLVARNFGIEYENASPFLPEEWPRLQIQNNWTAGELFHCVAQTPNLLFPFQASAAHAIQPPRSSIEHDDYCILVGDSAETWIYFWNRIFILRDFLRLRWNTLCLAPALLREKSFVGPLREFLKRHAQRSGNSPSSLTLLSFECPESELSELSTGILNDLDVIPRVKKLGSGEFPTVDFMRPEIFFGWGIDATQQQGTSRESLFSPPNSRVPIDRGVWVMDLRVQYFPRFDFYQNEVLSWKLPRRPGVANAFFNARRCRIDADYHLSVEMHKLESFILRLPEEGEIFHRAAGVMDSVIDSHRSNLIVPKKPRYRRLSPGDKGLYLNGILEIFGGLQSANRLFGHSYWRGIFERLSVGTAQKEAGLFERVRNTLEKKRSLIASQLANDSAKPIDWLSNFVIRQARELHVRQEEISFAELESSFQEQREQQMTANAAYRKTPSLEEIDEDRKAAKANLIGVLQELTDRGVLQQGVGVRCTNCGSWFWREMGSIRQKVQCDGCNATVPVPVESAWRYRLNSLVRNGIALHGCVPVIFALYALRERARESFIYTHGIALFKEYGDAKPEAEIDLLCISDGMLVCGEVKSSASDFTREELGKLARVATEIRADQVVISAFNDREGLMEQHRSTLASLLPVGCIVVTCGPRQWVFEPQLFA